MCLIPKINTILNTKGRKNADKLQACQNAWVTLKYMIIKTWEFELLNHFHAGINLSLHNAIMSIPHPTNKKFTLFHLVDKSRFETCHILTTVLKLLEVYGRAMIAGLLPYLLWKFVGDTDTHKRSIISQWFIPAVQQQAEDAYWDPQEECVKNMSNLMLSLAFATKDNALYWEQDKETPKSPKRQNVQVEEESLNDSVSTIKTAVSMQKLKSVLKNQPSQTNGKADGALSTYQQHLCTLGQLKCNTCPEKPFWMTWPRKSPPGWRPATQLSSPQTSTMTFTLTPYGLFSQFGLSDMCSTLHGSELPATHNCGTLPIDGIFAPEALIPMCHAGYLAFGKRGPE